MAETDTLKQLLEAEQEAESLVEDAEREREHMIEEARRKAQEAEDRFQQRIPEIRSSPTDDAKRRAQRAIEDLQQRVEQRKERLRSLGDTHADDAIDAVIRIILDPERP